MMYISALLITLISNVCIGFSEAAPRISPSDDASPGSASDTRRSFPADVPPSLAGNNSFALGSPNGHLPALAFGYAEPTASDTSSSTRTFQPPTTDPSTAGETGADSSVEGKDAAPISRWSGARKRSTDGQRTHSGPEKLLQTVVSVVSQRSANDAWAAESTEPPGTSAENSQESLCNCSSGAEGISDPDECVLSSGQCSCIMGYTGLQCEDCEDGYFTNGTSGCLSCACDSYGAVSSLCDSSGICECKTGVYGPKCDECHPGFFRFSATGCQPCQCHNHTTSCHPQSGVCLDCEGNTTGSNCEECKPGFYRIPGAALSRACAPCPCSNSTSTGTCHTDGSGFPVCDQCVGQHSGPRCAGCSAGSYRSGGGACVPCDCSGNAEVVGGDAQPCHPDTGHCLRCANNTAGPRCHLCAPGFEGDARAHNCTRAVPRPTPTSAGSTTTPPPGGAASSTTHPPGPASTTSPASFSTSSTNGSTALGPAPTTTAEPALLGSPSGPPHNTTALTQVSWTQFNIIVLAVIILVVVLLLGFVGGVYTYREYQNRKLNAPFWTIELKEDNISFSSYHDSIPNADVSGLLEDEANEVAPNGQLALTTQGNCYKA